jgi:hypothetical protein
LKGFRRTAAQWRLGVSERKREARVAIGKFAPLLQENRYSMVIDARHKFARKRCVNEYKWRPSPEIETKIVEAIFGKHKG